MTCKLYCGTVLYCLHFFVLECIFFLRKYISGVSGPTIINRHTTIFYLHDEQTINGLMKTAWASVFRLTSLCLHVHVSTATSPCLHGHVSMSPCLHVSMSPCLFLHVSMSMSPCFYVSMSMSPCFQDSATGKRN
jgi:hypothetical protein